MDNKNQSQNKKKQLLHTIAKYITSLYDSLTDEHPQNWISTPVMMISRGEGGLNLYGDEVSRYHECLELLAKEISPDIVSRKALDDMLRSAIVEAIDVNNSRTDTTFEQRLQAVIQKLQVELNKSPSNWQVYYRVSGLEPTYDPDTFGKIRFLRFDPDHFQSFKESIEQKVENEQSRELRLKYIHEFTEEPLHNKPVAIVEVSAIDVEAARVQALKELRLTVDVLNFYSDIFYAAMTAFVAIYGEDERSWEAVPVFVPGDNPVLIQSQASRGRLQTFSMNELIHKKGRELGSERVSQILGKVSRNQIENRLLSALQWAGRATVDERNEEAFLLYAIALESLIMERGNEPELGYRLRLRIAHLLGTNLESRKSIHTNVKYLYSIRSAIVHRGEYVVADSDLKLMRLYTKEAIVRLLINEPFVSMTSDKELLGWFDDQLLE